MDPVFDQQLTHSPLAAAWRYRWLVLALTIAGAALAYGYTTSTHSTQFVARASLVVSDPRASTLFRADEPGFDATRFVIDQVAILESDAVALRASELVGDAEPLFLERYDSPSGGFGFEIASDPDSDELVILYTAEDEATAVAAANAIIDAYAEVRRTEALRNSASAVQQLDASIDQIDAEFDSLQAQIDAARQDPAIADLEQQYRDALVDLARLQERLTTASGERLLELRAEIDDVNEQLVTLTVVLDIEEQRPELVQLLSQQDQALERRSDLAVERDRILVDTELLAGGVRLSSPARFAREISSRTTITTILGAMLGLFAGLGISYILANRRRRFTEPADPGWVLGAPMLAEIPNFLDELVPVPLPSVNHPQSASAEAFRFAATSLDLVVGEAPDGSGSGQAPHIFLFTSATMGAGKTVAVANVAVAAARKGRRVLAIDADFGHQALTLILRGPDASGAGITEVVEAGTSLEDATFGFGPPGTGDLLSRGERPGTAPDFFGLPATRALIERLGAEYDLVLIDGPPMLQVAYATTLARIVDQVVVVVPHDGSVSRNEDLAQRLALIGTPVAGYIYNLAPLRHDMTLSAGSLRDVLGEAPIATDEAETPPDEEPAAATSKSSSS